MVGLLGGEALVEPLQDAGFIAQAFGYDQDRLAAAAAKVDPGEVARHLAWVHLRSGSSQAILVIPEGLSDEASVLKWLDERFAAQEPDHLGKLNPALRSAVSQGRLVTDMSVTKRP